MQLECHYAGADCDGLIGRNEELHRADLYKSIVTLHVPDSLNAHYRSLANFLLTSSSSCPPRQRQSSTRSRCCARNSLGRWIRMRSTQQLRPASRAVHPEAALACAALLLAAAVHLQADQLAEQPQLGGALAGDAELH